jgi:hypothetical protein
MKPKFLFSLWVVSSLFVFEVHASTLLNFSKKLGNASVSFHDNKLTVSTGKVEREWLWSGTGFQTISYRNLKSGKQWSQLKPAHSSDWGLPKRIEKDAKGELISVDCVETDDDRFAENHLLVSALVHYDFGLDVKFLIRVYPDAPGLWTALEVKSGEGFSPDGIPADNATYKSYGSNQPVKIARSEFIPVDFSQRNQRHYWGFYNNPGNRVNTQDMVEEKVMRGFPVFQDEENSWASGLSIESGTDGLILLKESNKTVNQYGHQTGSFYCTPNGVEVTGWGLKPNEITSVFKRTWATWTILYNGGDDQMQLALKQFDRFRFPVHPERDMHILIDTWGSDWQNGNYKQIYGRENSEFSVVKREIISASDLGIDIVRIDDGWQDGGTMSNNTWHPNTKSGYDPHWENIKKLSNEYKVGIGLWAAVRYISPEEMFTNQKELGVATWKFDFDQLEDHDSFAKRLNGVRDFIKKTGYVTQTSWCPEYDDQRYGWYSPVRECGPMYFQNIQNNLPNHLVYVPYITLRHHWMMSKYYNMNQLQCHWQNPALTNPAFSDANQHSQSYCALTAFMAAPSCFMLTQLLQPKERDELRKIIKVYKDNRKEIFESYIFPIGTEPNNASWTGFQVYHPEKKSGYLMVFRELHNPDKNGTVKLRFIQSKKIRIIDLEDNSVQTVQCKDGVIHLTIDHPAGYKFLKYEIYM